MDDGTDLPTDVLVYILQRLQPDHRRRLRLICRHWRHVVDTRTVTSLRGKGNMLLDTVEGAYVFDELAIGLRSWEIPVCPFRYARRNEVVGTCNGIVCIRDNYGGIFLHNPLTGDRLAVPSLPPQYKTWAGDFSFTYDRATRRYMIMRVPYSLRGVMVFTLGEAAWRVIPGDIYLHHHGNGIVTIDNMMYWAEWDIVMSLDLNSERPPSVIPLPSPRLAGGLRLTQVLGMLGIVFSNFSGTVDKMEVWVMERGASIGTNHVGWSRRYSVHIERMPRHQPQWHDHQHLTWPHFAHGSNHILTWKWLPTGGCALYRHMASNDNTKAPCGTVVVNERNQGTLMAHIETKYDTFRRFDYVQTREPLLVYKRW